MPRKARHAAFQSDTESHIQQLIFSKIFIEIMKIDTEFSLEIQIQPIAEFNPFASKALILHANCTQPRL